MRVHQDIDHIEPKALTLIEFCATYCIGQTTAYAELKAGRLRAKKIGSKTLIPVAEAERWFDNLPEIDC